MNAFDLVLMFGPIVGLMVGTILARDWLWEKRQAKFDSVEEMLRKSKAQ